MADSDSGCGCLTFIGTLIAGALSWAKSGSLVWLAIHLILGWLYVAYYVLRFVVLEYVQEAGYLTGYL